MIWKIRIITSELMLTKIIFMAIILRKGTEAVALQRRYAVVNSQEYTIVGIDGFDKENRNLNFGVP